MLPRVRTIARLVQFRFSQRGERTGPIDGLRHARSFVQAHIPYRLHRGGDLTRQPFSHLGNLEAHDCHFALELGMLDPVVQAPPLERIVHVPGAVGCEDDDRWICGPKRPELGHRDRVVRQDLEQEGLELVVGPVDLVDDQYRRHEAVRRVGDGAQQRPADQEPLREQLVLHRPAAFGTTTAGAVQLGRTEMEELAREVPFIDRLTDVYALVALETYQLSACPP